MKKKKIWLLLLIGLIFGLGYKFLFLGTYFVPASTSLGTCHKDWTSDIYEPRRSPLTSLSFQIDETEGLLCFGAPSARGRVLFGNGDSLSLVYEQKRHDLIGKKGAEVVTYDKLWRMGANEPTRIFLNKNIRVDDLELSSGRYSMYAIPNPNKWEVFFSTSIFHWGNAIGKSVIEKEVGSISVDAVHDTTYYAETLEFEFQEKTDTSFIIMRWGNIKAPIPFFSKDN